MTWFRQRFDSSHDHLPSDVYFDNVGGDEVDIRDALRLGERFEVNDEGSYHDKDDDNALTTRQIGIDADGARKVIIHTEQIDSEGGDFAIRVNGRNSGYSNYYKDGSAAEGASEAVIATNMTPDTPWVGIIEIHSRDVVSIIARGAKPGLPAETLDYAVWQHPSNNPATANIEDLRFMGIGGGLRMRRTQIFSVYTKERDHEYPDDW